MTRSPIAGSVRSADDRLALATEPTRRRRGGGGSPVTASPLASGLTADVYGLDGDRVLRRYRSGGDVRAEADLMRHLHAHGYPVPRVHHLLVACLAEIGPVVALGTAVALRADTGTLDASLLPEAAALVRSVTARIRPPLPAGRVHPGGGAAPGTVWGVGPAGGGAR